jgi:hypothetical protein
MKSGGSLSGINRHVLISDLAMLLARTWPDWLSPASRIWIDAFNESAVYPPATIWQRGPPHATTKIKAGTPHARARGMTSFVVRLLICFAPQTVQLRVVVSDGSSTAVLR